MKQLVFLIACQCILPLQVLLAQWDAIEDLAICTNSGTQLVGQVISDHNGGVWVMWAHRVPHKFDQVDSNRHGLQHLDSNGYALIEGNGLTLNDSIQTNQIIGAYATLDGSLTVCYRGIDSFAHRPKAYLQRFRSDGSRVWGYAGKSLTNIAADTFTLKAHPISLLPLNDGRAYLSFRYNGEGTLDTTYIQLIDVDGSYEWGDTGKYLYNVYPMNTGSGRLFPRDEGGAYFAYAKLVDSNMHVNGVDSLGNLLYADVDPIVADPRRLMSDFIITSRHDVDSVGMMVYKSNEVFSSSTGSREELRLHLFNAAGERSTPVEGTLLSDTSSSVIYHILPQVDGSAIYSYLSSNTVITPLYARCVSPTGTSCWEHPIILGGADSSRTRIHMSQDTSGIVLTWDEGDSSRFIMAQMLNASNGTLLWGDTAILVGSQHVNTRSYPIHDRDIEGNCIVCWTDLRNAATTKEDIYCAKVLNSGLLVTVIDRSVRAGISALTSASYPNPADNAITFEIRSEVDDIVTVSIFDNIGRLVHIAKKIACVRGENAFRVEFGNVPNGRYSYEILGKEVDARGQFVVAR